MSCILILPLRSCEIVSDPFCLAFLVYHFGLVVGLGLHSHCGLTEHGVMSYDIRSC